MDLVHREFRLISREFSSGSAAVEGHAVLLAVDDERALLDWAGIVTAPFIDRSSEMWNFLRDRPLYLLSCSIRKVMP